MEKGFETIKALDIELLNKNLRDLMLEREVEIPKYDFTSGQRKEKGEIVKISKNTIIILEGIHGLNNSLIEGIFKVTFLKFILVV